MEVCTRTRCATHRCRTRSATTRRFIDDMPTVPRRKYSVLPALLSKKTSTAISRSSPFERLTTQILRAILLRLHSANHLCVCAVVASAWKCAVDDEALWHEEAHLSVTFAMCRWQEPVPAGTAPDSLPERIDWCLWVRKYDRRSTHSTGSVGMGRQLEARVPMHANQCDCGINSRARGGSGLLESRCAKECQPCWYVSP